MLLANLNLNLVKIECNGHRPMVEQALFPQTSASSANRCTERAMLQRSDQPYQADSDGSGHDMVWLDLSA